MKQAPDLIGQKFDRLRVVGRTRNIKNQCVWLCICDCGNDKSVRNGNLPGIKSCGCLRLEGAMKARGQKDILPAGEAAWRELLRHYHAGAKRRKISWNLADEDFRFLTQQDCFYCGDPPSGVMKKKSGDYIYSGVDRMDSSGPYNVENVVSCCTPCNLMKRSMPLRDFLARVSRIAKRQEEKQILAV